MAAIIKARARYVGHTEGFFTNAGSTSFYTIKIKQDGWKVIIIVEGDETKQSRTEYATLVDFLDKWDICCALNITRT